MQIRKGFFVPSQSVHLHALPEDIRSSPFFTECVHVQRIQLRKVQSPKIDDNSLPWSDISWLVKCNTNVLILWTGSRQCPSDCLFNQIHSGKDSHPISQWAYQVQRPMWSCIKYACAWHQLIQGCSAQLASNSEQRVLNEAQQRLQLWTNTASQPRSCISAVLPVQSALQLLQKSLLASRPSRICRLLQRRLRVAT